MNQSLFRSTDDSKVEMKVTYSSHIVDGLKIRRWLNFFNSFFVEVINRSNQLFLRYVEATFSSYLGKIF